MSASRAASVAARLLALGKRLSADCSRLEFGPPVTHVYDPLVYAAEPHRRYVRRYADGPKRVLFVGMNPGPFGMAQTGVPFGEIAAVRDWLGITGRVGKPPEEAPKRPVLGFGCPRSEVSGRRLWALFRERFGEAEAFFADHFVLNYCPLMFIAGAGGSCRNLTPDKLPPQERGPLLECCDRHLTGVLDALEIRIAVGIGKFAAERLRDCAPQDLRIATMPHPSPANPAANSGYAKLASEALRKEKIWA